MVKTGGARSLAAIRKGGSENDIGEAMTRRNKNLRGAAETLFLGCA
jgi:hypothetical protein